MADVWLPPRLQRLTGGEQVVQVAGETVRQLIENLEHAYPGMKAELYDEEEDIVMPGMSVIIDGETSQLGLLERVPANSEVHFLPALGGGV
jgi:sulfur-carrier protein